MLKRGICEERMMRSVRRSVIRRVVYLLVSCLILGIEGINASRCVDLHNKIYYGTQAEKLTSIQNLFSVLCLDPQIVDIAFHRQSVTCVEHGARSDTPTHKTTNLL